MIYPFVTHSLTRNVDKKIHRAVRLAAPVKYWIFRISYYLDRAGFALGVMSFFLYFIGYSVVRSAGHLENAEFAEFVDVLAKAVVVSISISVTGALLQTILIRELEPLAQRAIQRIGNEPS